jgi:hypothetical protein
VASLALGLAIGALSLLGDAVGIRVLNGLANAAGSWLLVAFVSGSLHPDLRAGGLAGAATLLFGVVAYYLGIGVVFGPDRTYAGPLILMWVGAALAGGAVFGGAGSAWSSAAGRRRAILGALPAAALLAEAAHRLVQVAPWEGFDPSGTYAQVMVAEAVAGAIVLWLAMRGPEHRAGYAAAAGLTVAGLAAFLAVEGLARVLAYSQ